MGKTIDITDEQLRHARKQIAKLPTHEIGLVFGVPIDKLSKDDLITVIEWLHHGIVNRKPDEPEKPESKIILPKDF